MQELGESVFVSSTVHAESTDARTTTRRETPLSSVQVPELEGSYSIIGPDEGSCSIMTLMPEQSVSSVAWIF